MEGFVTKRGHLITNWKVRWFILENGEIRYFKDRAEQVIKGRYILRKDSILTLHADMGLNRNIIMIFTTSHPFRKRALYFSCDSAETQGLWMGALTKAIDALKTGIPMTPAPLPTMASPALIVTNAIDSIANILSNTFDSITGDSQESEDTAVLTAMANNSSNKTRQKPAIATEDAPAQSDTRPRSIDHADRRLGKPVKIVGLGSAKRLKPTTPTVSSCADVETNNYTAADYDSSDTDGSMADDGARSRSASDLSRQRPASSGGGGTRSQSNLHSATSTTSTSHSPVGPSSSNGHSASTAAEAMYSPYSPAPQKPQRRSSAITSTSTAEEFALPRVSEIVAVEARHSKKTPPEAISPKIPADPASSSGKEEKPAKPSKPTSLNASSPSSAQRATTPTKADAAGGKTSSTNQNKAANTLGSSSKGSDRSVSPVPTDSENPWIEAYTAEGELYYYHKVSRLARWDKPDSHIVEAMESRLKDIDLASERSLKERKEAIERNKQKEAENEAIKSESMSEIEKAVKEWSLDKKRTGRELSFPELLRDLVFVLPSDLLLVVYDSQHKVVLDAMQEFSVNSPPAEVKRAYLRVVRFVHPDKLPPTLQTASKLLVERIFIHLTQKYDTFRKAHDLG